LRRNIGRHVIISGKSHDALRRACAEGDVKMSEVADKAIQGFCDTLAELGTEGRISTLKAAVECSEIRKERGKIVAPSEE